MQGAILNFIQHNLIKTRIVESLALLRTGILPEDLVNPKDLKRIIEDAVASKVPNGLKVAFENADVNLFYRQPLASLAYKDGRKYIDLYIPLIKKEKVLKFYKLTKLSFKPVHCWSKTKANCDANKNYVLEVKNNMILSSDDEVIASLKKEDLECLSNFENKMCWIIENEENLIIDECLKGIYNEKEIKNCTYKVTREPVRPLKVKPDVTFKTVYDQNGLLVAEKFDSVMDQIQTYPIDKYIPDIKAYKGVFESPKIDMGEIMNKGIELQKQVAEIKREQEVWRNKKYNPITHVNIAEEVKDYDFSVLNWVLHITPFLVLTAFLINNN